LLRQSTGVAERIICSQRNFSHQRKTKPADNNLPDDFVIDAEK
jgi:hypothetical protein